MLHILLLILKIIGFVLLGILALVLLAVTAVLFVPFRYNGSAEKDDGITAQGRVTWLLHILKVRFFYSDSTPDIEARLFGIRIYHNTEDEKDKAKNQKVKTEKASGTLTPTAAADVDETVEIELSKEFEDFVDSKPEQTGIVTTENEPESEAEAEPGTKEEPESKNESESGTEAEYDPDRKQSQKKAKEKAKRKVKRKKQKKSPEEDKKEANGIADKLKNLYNKWERIRSIINDDRVRSTVKLIKRQVGKVLKAVLPRRIKGNVEFGFDDPSTTGYVCAVLGALYGKLGPVFTFKPDFENSILKGNIKAKGRIRIFTVGIAVLKVLLNKDFKYTKKLIKRDNKGA